MTNQQKFMTNRTHKTPFADVLQNKRPYKIFQNSQENTCAGHNMTYYDIKW